MQRYDMRIILFGYWTTVLTQVTCDDIIGWCVDNNWRVAEIVPVSEDGRWFEEPWRIDETLKMI